MYSHTGDPLVWGIEVLVSSACTRYQHKGLSRAANLFSLTAKKGPSLLLPLLLLKLSAIQQNLRMKPEVSLLKKKEIEVLESIKCFVDHSSVQQTSVTLELLLSCYVAADLSADCLL